MVRTMLGMTALAAVLAGGLGAEPAHASVLCVEVGTAVGGTIVEYCTPV